MTWLFYLFYLALILIIRECLKDLSESIRTESNLRQNRIWRKFPKIRSCQNNPQLSHAEYLFYQSLPQNKTNSRFRQNRQNRF